MHNVLEQLRSIKSYIENTYFSKRAGDNTINNTRYGLQRLEIFPKLVLILNKNQK